jgi:hypothetical protein
VVYLRQLYEKYSDRIQFLFVYVREGHGGTMTGQTFPEALREFAEPAGAPPGSRLRLLPRVRAGRNHFGLRFPILLDNEEGEVATRYNASGMRVLIVDRAGRIVLNCGVSSFLQLLWMAITDWLDRYSASLSPL